MIVISGNTKPLGGDMKNIFLINWRRFHAKGRGVGVVVYLEHHENIFNRVRKRRENSRSSRQYITIPYKPFRSLHVSIDELFFFLEINLFHFSYAFPFSKTIGVSCTTSNKIPHLTTFHSGSLPKNCFALDTFFSI